MTTPLGERKTGFGNNNQNYNHNQLFNENIITKE